MFNQEPGKNILTDENRKHWEQKGLQTSIVWVYASKIVSGSHKGSSLSPFEFSCNFDDLINHMMSFQSGLRSTAFTSTSTMTAVRELSEEFTTKHFESSSSGFRVPLYVKNLVSDLSRHKNIS